MIELQAGLPRSHLIPIRSKRFSLLQSVQTSAGIYPLFCSVGSGGSFSWGQLAEVWSLPLILICAEVRNDWSCTSTSLYAF